VEEKLFFGLMIATMVTLEAGERLLRPVPILCTLAAGAWFAV
jgi:hypothetical protein